MFNEVIVQKINLFLKLLKLRERVIALYVYRIACFIIFYWYPMPNRSFCSRASAADLGVGL